MSKMNLFREINYVNFLTVVENLSCVIVVRYVYKYTIFDVFDQTQLSPSKAEKTRPDHAQLTQTSPSDVNL